MIIINPSGVPVTEDMTLRDLVKASAEHGKTVIITMDDPWIEWGGGEMPVPKDTYVEVVFRDGTTWHIQEAWNHGWSHFDNDYDIIAYRVHESDIDPYA